MTKSHHSMISFYMSHPSESGLRFYFIFCTFLHKYDLEKVVYDLLNFWWTLNFLFTCMSNIGICHVLFHVAYGLYLLYFVICHIFFKSKGMGVQPALYMSVAFYQCSKLERVYLYLSLFFFRKKCMLYIINRQSCSASYNLILLSHRRVTGVLLSILVRRANLSSLAPFVIEYNPFLNMPILCW